MTIAATPVLESFVGQEYLLLTTYRRTGTQAGTPATGSTPVALACDTGAVRRSRTRK